MTIRVTAFTKYDSQAASTRQRLLQYIPALEAAGIAVDHRPLFDNDYMASLAEGSRYPRARVAKAYARRLGQLISSPLGDVIWIYAELFPWLPAPFERLSVRRGLPIVYDFDDAFFHNYDDHSKPWVRALLRGKLDPLIRAAKACTCGNRYLQEYAARLCPNSIVLPTVVDTDVYKPNAANRIDRIVIGWIGSPSTWNYVRPLFPLFANLAKERGIIFRAIGAGRAADADRFAGLELVEWSEKSEVAELQRFDIGIMPVPDDPWARGKSGYKLIQYMACGLPVVASPVGVNEEIVGEGENGFLATSESDWRSALERLIDDGELRSRMGSAGRERAAKNYSLAAYAPCVVEVIRSAAARS